MLFSKEWYLANAGAAGTVMADAHFITDLTGKAQERVWGNKSYGYPGIYAALGVESLAAGIQTAGLGYAKLTLLNGGVDPNFDRWEIPMPWWGTIGDITAGDLSATYPTPVYENFDRHILNMPYPSGSSLADGTVSKVYGSAANTYSAIVFYQMAGARAPPPKGGRVTVISYDKGGDSTTVVWNTFENAAQNAAGDLREEKYYRLLWGAMDAQALNDKEANLARVTVPGYPPLIFPGGGCYYGQRGARRIMFLTDSVVMKGNAVHKVEGHIGAACQPLIHLAWEEM